MPDVILDPFHRILNAGIEERLTELKEKLAHGGASAGDRSVAESYAAVVGQIYELEIVQAMCRQIENEQNSLQPRVAKVNVQQR